MRPAGRAADERVEHLFDVKVWDFADRLGLGLGFKDDLGRRLGREIDALDLDVVDFALGARCPFDAAPDADLPAEIVPDDFLHLVQIYLGRRLELMALAILADIDHGFRHDERTFARKLFPNHVAHDLPIASVIELRDKVERDDDLARVVGGKRKGRRAKSTEN